LLPRIRQIRAHHAERLECIMGHAKHGPVTAAGLLPVLFRPDLDAHQLGFAMGEALAHLNHLWAMGQLQRLEAEDRVRFVRD
jgi:hypothetical protein